MGMLGLANPTTAVNLGIVIVRSDGQVWDFKANAYAALGAGGIPTANQVSAMAHPIAAGPLTRCNFLNLPQSYDAIGSFVCIFPMDGAGNLGTMLDMFPGPLAIQPYIGAPGGVST